MPVDRIMHNKVGVLIWSEASYLGATQGVVAQFQELTRFLNQTSSASWSATSTAAAKSSATRAGRCRALGI